MCLCVYFHSHIWGREGVLPVEVSLSSSFWINQLSQRPQSSSINMAWLICEENRAFWVLSSAVYTSGLAACCSLLPVFTEPPPSHLLSPKQKTELCPDYRRTQSSTWLTFPSWMKPFNFTAFISGVTPTERTKSLWDSEGSFSVSRYIKHHINI